jgi:low temperature requirement protein LtrA
MPRTSPGAVTSTRSTPLELLFNLVVVFAITQLTSLNGA